MHGPCQDGFSQKPHRARNHPRRGGAGIAALGGIFSCIDANHGALIQVFTHGDVRDGIACLTPTIPRFPGSVARICHDPPKDDLQGPARSRRASSGSYATKYRRSRPCPWVRTRSRLRRLWSVSPRGRSGFRYARISSALRPSGCTPSSATMR
jgi:hypothetical protein